MQQARLKDVEACNQLVALTQQSLYVFCFYLTRSKPAAEDLTHDTYLKGFLVLDQLKEPSALLPWLKTIARHLFLDQKRAAPESQQILSLEDLRPKELSQNETGASDLVDQLAAYQALQQLEESDRSLLVLIEVQGQSYSEVAQILEIPEGTVKSRLNRARQKFSLIFHGTKKP